MIVCQCRVISDKTIKAELSKTEGRATVGELYKRCSGGQGPNCNSCACNFKEHVVAHNAARTVEHIRQNMQEPAEKKVEAA